MSTDTVEESEQRFKSAPPTHSDGRLFGRRVLTTKATIGSTYEVKCAFLRSVVVVHGVQQHKGKKGALLHQRKATSRNDTARPVERGRAFAQMRLRCFRGSCFPGFSVFLVFRFVPVGKQRFLRLPSFLLPSPVRRLVVSASRQRWPSVHSASCLR